MVLPRVFSSNRVTQERTGNKAQTLFFNLIGVKFADYIYI